MIDFSCFRASQSTVYFTFVKLLCVYRTYYRDLGLPQLPTINAKK